MHYFHNLYDEIDACKDLDVLQNYHVKSVFIGGGTPSSVEPFYIKEVMNRLRKVFCFAKKQDLEITIETNPGTLTKEKLEIYREAGINRLSIGLQSTDNEELKVLGRIHTYEEFLENYQLARSCGFQNINVDLMSALPGQTTEKWKRTLNQIITLAPEHISAYSLIIEEGTPFYTLYNAHEELLPDEDSEREMYYLTKKILENHGYKRYEISNYAKQGKECRHNTGYWERVPYLGFGCSAASLFMDKRTENPADMAGYEAAVKDGKKRRVTELSQKEKMEEFMFLGLRMIKGISRNEFLWEFKVPIEQVYQPVIHRLRNGGLLDEKGDRIFLTEYGIDVSNAVLAEFLL